MLFPTILQIAAKVITILVVKDFISPPLTTSVQMKNVSAHE
jgi:hypothetical protein